MNLNHLLISIVIPVYNSLPTLQLQIEALRQQKVTYPFEILIADNGSNDGLKEWVQAYQKSKFNNLRYIDCSAHRGAAYARNFASSQARGKYLLFCDADDLVDEYWVSDAFEALQLYPVVTGSAVTVYESDFSEILTPTDGWKKFGPRVTQDIYQESGMGSMAPALLGGNFAIHKELFEELGGFDAYFSRGSEDNDLSYRIKKSGVVLMSSQNMRILYRIREDTLKLIARGYQTGKTFSELAAKHDAWGWALPYHSLTLLSIPKSFLKFLFHWRPNDTEGNIFRFSTFLTVVGLLVGKYEYKILKRKIEYKEGLGLI